MCAAESCLEVPNFQSRAKEEGSAGFSHFLMWKGEDAQLHSFPKIWIMK